MTCNSGHHMSYDDPHLEHFVQSFSLQGSQPSPSQRGGRSPDSHYCQSCHQLVRYLEEPRHHRSRNERGRCTGRIAVVSAP